MASPQIVGGTTQAVTGAEEFARALRKMSPQIKRELDKRNREIGKEVIAKAKGRASGVSRQAARASAAMSATGARGGVAIRLAGRKVPFALGAEFGAKRYPQFMAWTGNQWSGIPEGVGYFMHPTIRDSVPDVVNKYLDACQDAAARSGLRMSPRAATGFDIARGVN